MLWRGRFRYSDLKKAARGSGDYVIKEVKRHSFYLKPGEKKRVKQALARNVPERKAEKNRIKLRSKAAAAKQRPPACEHL